jgi:hypothetical protein
MIEDTLAKLVSEFNAKAAELRALDSERHASQQRLDDCLKKEAAAQVALQQVTATLDKANKDLAEARRAADQIRSKAAAERDRILSSAHQEAARIVEEAERAVADAANLIRRKPAA